MTESVHADIYVRTSQAGSTHGSSDDVGDAGEIHMADLKTACSRQSLDCSPKAGRSYQTFYRPC